MKPPQAIRRLLPLALVLLSACATGEQLTRRNQPSPRVGPAPAATPRGAYTALLEATRDSGIVRTWEAAGAEALRAPLHMASTNLTEILAFPPELAIAATYRFDMRRGETLDVEVRKDRGTSGVFMDVFEELDGDFYRHREGTDRDRSRLSFTASTDGLHVLRIQPPAGAGGRFTIHIKGNRRDIASSAEGLAFPVANAGPSAIRGQWGDARDGGARSHKGVDIFAPRGTLVTAAADGVISSVDNTAVGGRIVWQRDERRGLLYYYAHLDEQLVREGERVGAGDAIGRVGNTGNASGGSPHLHFGVFQSGYEALDPTPMLASKRVSAPVSEERSQPPAALGRRVALPAENVRLRNGPAETADIMDELPAGASVLLLGAIGGWTRVVLENGRTGFIATHLLER